MRRVASDDLLGVSGATLAITLAAVGALVSACGAETQRGRADVTGAGGDSGSGSGGSGGRGSGGVPGMGGTVGLGSCSESLSALCAEVACPERPTDVDVECYAGDAPVGGTKRFPSSCGGPSVSVFRGLGQRVWHFDAEERLIGYEAIGDLPGMCSDGTFGYSKSYGRICTAVGPATDLCAMDCPAIACIPTATLRVSPSLSHSEAAAHVVRACRNEECYSATVLAPLGGGNTIELVGGGAAYQAQVSVWFDASSGDAPSIVLIWALDGGDFGEPDRYVLTIHDPDSGAEPEVLIDERVSYEIRDLGCAGTCRAANVTLDPSSAGGASGAAGASGAGGVAGAGEGGSD